jgi:hypothetical protein
MKTERQIMLNHNVSLMTAKQIIKLCNDKNFLKKNDHFFRLFDVVETVDPWTTGNESLCLALETEAKKAVLHEQYHNLVYASPENSFSEALNCHFGVELYHQNMSVSDVAMLTSELTRCL